MKQGLNCENGEIVSIEDASKKQNMEQSKERQNTLATIKQMIADGQLSQEVAERYFPELALSEDEKIRKDIHTYLYNELHNIQQLTPRTNEFERWLAWLKKRGEQKPAEWDESIIDETISLINKLASGYGEKVDEPITFNGVKMINNIKERLRAIKPQPKQEWSEEDENILKTLIHLVRDYNWQRITCGFVGADREAVLYWLLSLKDRVLPQPKPEWSEEDERIYASIMDDTVQENQLCGKQINWLRSLKYRCLTQLEKEWSEEDEKTIEEAIEYLEKYAKECVQGGNSKQYIFGIASRLDSLRPQKQCGYNPYKEVIESIAEMCEKYKLPTSNLSDFLDNVKVKCKEAKEYDSMFPQKHWKPSDEMLEALYRAVLQNVKEISEDEILLDKLYQGLKYGKILSK